MGRKQESSFSEEKEAKRLSSIRLPGKHRALMDKSFLVLFFKKEHLPSLDPQHVR
jgi:hypothetical protein